MYVLRTRKGQLVARVEYRANEDGHVWLREVVWDAKMPAIAQRMFVAKAAVALMRTTQFNCTFSKEEQRLKLFDH